MDDYMDKQTAINLLDNLIGMVEDTQENDYDTALKMGIEALKTHVQPVVRCKDCKYRHLDGMIWNCPFGLSGGEGFFCAYGAKDGEQND